MEKIEKILIVGAITPPWDKQINFACIPYSAVAVASFLENCGYQCEVISTAIISSWQSLLEKIIQCDLVGVSCMSGPDLKYGIEITKKIRQMRPSLPIVWGGYHGTLNDTNIVEEGLADYVVRGMGEYAIRDLIQALQNKTSLEKITGITWKKNEQIIRNPDSVLIDVNDLPIWNYELVHGATDELLADCLPYITSRGCPFNCSYCVASSVYERKYLPKSSEKVIDELVYYHQKYAFKSIFFWDDNLLVDYSRLVRIFEGLRKKGVSFEWFAFCRADLMLRLDSDKVAFLKDHGLRSVSFGAESGSNKVLKKLRKGVTVEQLKQATEFLLKEGVNTDYSLMGGLPGETDEDFQATLDLMTWALKKNPDISLRMFRFVPFPKMSILDDIHLDHARQIPQKIAEWEKTTYQETVFPWVPKSVNCVLKILVLGAFFPTHPKVSNLFSFIKFLLHKNYILRVRYQLYRFSPESYLVMKFVNWGKHRVWKQFQKFCSENQHRSTRFQDDSKIKKIEKIGY
ncbi:MAG: radical SAM protein [Pseudomonadota bacterium]